MITISVIHKDETQANGKRWVVYRLVDHLGVEHISFPKMCEAAFDADADLILKTTQLEEQLAKVEEQAAINVSDVLNYVQNPQHTTSKKIIYWLLRHMMKMRDPYIVLKLESLILYLRANYTANQLANFLGLTVPQLSRMNAKINSVLDNKQAFLDSDTQEGF